MNNEEKILEMLGQLKQGQDEMRGDIASLKQGQNEMRGQLDGLNSRVSSLETDVREIKYTVERIDKSIKRLWVHGMKHEENIWELQSEVK